MTNPREGREELTTSNPSPPHSSLAEASFGPSESTPMPTFRNVEVADPEGGSNPCYYLVSFAARRAGRRAALFLRARGALGEEAIHLTVRRARVLSLLRLASRT